MRTPLQSLLSLKRWEEDEAKSRFAFILKELAIEEGRLLELENSYASAGKLRGGHDGKATTIDELKRLQEYLEFLLKNIHKQEKIIRNKAEEAERARQVLLNVSKERKTFEKLDDKRKETVEKDVLRKEQIMTDEHGVTRHSREKI